MSRTLIKGGQIKLTDFIQALASVDWTSDTLTVSAAAIASKIQSEIAGVTGAVQYRGSWAQAATDAASTNGIKKGYVYVYDGNGTAPTGVTLENGDTLIANTDSASVSNSAHWTIVQVNITGAITEANLVTALQSFVVSGNTNALTIAAGTGTNAGKLVVTANFPTIQNGTAESGKYISAISINSTTGKITVTKAALPTMPDYRNYWVFDETMTGSVDGVNTTFYTGRVANSADLIVVYVNGVRQHRGDDITVTKVSDSTSNTGKGCVVFSSSTYIPQEGDSVTCDYITEDEVSE